MASFQIFQTSSSLHLPFLLVLQLEEVSLFQFFENIFENFNDTGPAKIRRQISKNIPWPRISLVRASNDFKLSDISFFMLITSGAKERNIGPYFKSTCLPVPTVSIFLVSITRMILIGRNFSASFYRMTQFGRMGH